MLWSPILHIHCQANTGSLLHSDMRMEIYQHNEQRSAGLDLNNPSQADRLRNYWTENPYMKPEAKVITGETNDVIEQHQGATSFTDSDRV